MKVAIVGIGNCCSSLVQAVEAAKQGGLGTDGLSHPDLAGYKPEHIDFVAAFDIDTRKIGKDLSEAIFSAPNCTTKYFNVSKQGCVISLGRLEDGIAMHMEGVFNADKTAQNVSEDEVIDVLKSSSAEIVVCYLPVGSHKAAEFYAKAAAKAGCAFVNCMPTPLANNAEIVKLYENAGLPLLGDDIKSQIGSTSIHRALIDILEKKGVTIQRTYQLNIGGNTDFMNMRNPDRASSKKHTKESSLNHLFSNTPELGVGPSDYVPQLKDHKVGYINIEGIGLMGMPFSIEMKLKVEDSPNSAGVVINAIRSARVALDRKIKGVVMDACPWFFKNPPEQLDEDNVFTVFENFVRGQA